ncbi:hypothetical protein WG906_08650 [Pedobacter sp. P351]|uniref:hypothetical protein n=1 Tax=Pedobacter superstes TaxID=3133441 RepID=UPI0030B5370A
MTIYKFNELYDRIDEILWKYWDPMGVNNNEELRDTYKSYTPHIFRLKTDREGKQVIATKLFEIETRIIGFPGNIVHCHSIADRIEKIRIS